MTDRSKLSVKGVWLIVSLSSVVLPVFLPSLREGNIFGNALGVATVSMFFLSFPSSLLAVPLASFISFVFGIDSWSLAGLYMNVLTLFALGVFQWFWIVPGIFKSTPLLQRLDLGEAGSCFTLGERRGETGAAWPQADAATPLERVIRDDR